MIIIGWVEGRSKLNNLGDSFVKVVSDWIEISDGYYSGNKILRWVDGWIKLKWNDNVPLSYGRPETSKEVIER